MPGQIIKTKNCKNCGIEYSITDKDLEFYNKISPTFDGKEYQIPVPTHCSDCRQQRRLAWRNERKLYKRKCNFTGKPLISNYSPEKGQKIIDKEIWWSDKFDPMNYGRNFDFDRGFFEQFLELLKTVPIYNLLQNNSENSDYTNDADKNKNCYLCSTSRQNEDCLYLSNAFWVKNSVDGFWLLNSELCYDCVQVNGGYKLFHSSFCYDCSESIYLYDCRNLKNSALCVGLRNSSYCFLNKKLVKQEYEKEIENVNNDVDYKNKCLDKYHKLLLEIPRVQREQSMCENCVGDNLSGCKQSNNVYDAHYCENCSNVFQGGNIYDIMDASITGSNDPHGNCLEVLSAAESDKTFFSITVRQSTNVYYSKDCFACKNIFGCFGLRNKEYCIFNKQYSKEEYEKNVAKIIEKMIADSERGEFFPIKTSVFGYNETLANDYFPLSQEDAKKLGYNWQDLDYPINVPEGIETIEAKDLADLQVASSKLQNILDKAIICEVTGKPFRIIKLELDFYIKYGIDLPTRHPDIRQLDRLKVRNPRKLFDRKCDKCGVDITTTYSPDRSEAVYCEQCYEKEIY